MAKSAKKARPPAPPEKPKKPRPLAPLSDKMRRVLLAMLELQEEDRRSTANGIGDRCGYQAGMARRGNHGRGNTTRTMGTSVHVNTTLINLKKRGLVYDAPDYEFALTDEGEREAWQARSDGLDAGEAATADGWKRDDLYGWRRD